MRFLRPDRRETADIEVLANGGFWPLEGFQGDGLVSRHTASQS
jgi:hypothetical protein